MKKVLLISALFLVFLGCKKDSKVQVEANGLTADINSLVPQTTIDAMVAQGMPINKGNTPPTINGVFNATPFILKATTVPNDYALGHQFADYRVQFHQQDNTKLTIEVDYVAGSEQGTGIGSFIVGSGTHFTVFVKVNVTNAGKSAVAVEVISGSLESGSIKNFYFANFMIDNGGNTAQFMANGTGRVLYDSDGTSESVASLKSAQISNGIAAGASAPIGK